MGFSVFDLFLLVLFGVLGMFMKYVGLPPAPLILAFIIGPLMENSFGQSLTISQGGLWIFWDTTICKIFLICIGLTIVRIVCKSLVKEPALKEKQPLTALEEK